MRRASLWGVIAVLAVLAAGLAIGQSTMGTSSSSSPSTPATTPVTTPASSQSNASTKAQTPVQLGAQLYAANCQTCHGTKGQGGTYRGIRGADRISFSRFKRIILYGAERMPGYAKTGLSTSTSLGSLGANGYLGNSKAPSDQQIQDLLAYLKTLPGASRGGFFGGDD